MIKFQKSKLLIMPFLIGIILMVFSWYSSYPLYIASSDDLVFNHVSILYWFGLALILSSLYLVAITTKSNILKWIVTVSLVITMYSLSYFYAMLPGSDSQYFRGLTEYCIKTNDPTSLMAKDYYFGTPAFFLLGKITTSIGLELTSVEFIMYTIIGFLFATALYVYSSKAYKKGGFLAVIAFFLAMLYFLNYQYAPFSLAFAFLLLLFMLETHVAESLGRTVTILVLFTGMALTHTFVPIFFILYQLGMCIFRRRIESVRIFLLTSTIYLAVQLFQNPFSFAHNVTMLITTSPEYAMNIEGTLETASMPLDVIAQTFSRSVVISTVIICGIGFIALLVKRKMRVIDKAVLFSGVVYSTLGAVVFLLGSRTWPLVFIPISLGASYLFESKFRPYLKFVFMVLLILFLFIPLHITFLNNDVMFQTREAYKAENFFIDHYNWVNPSLIMANYRVATYIDSTVTGNANFAASLLEIEEADSIFYTVGLGLQLPARNYTIEKIVYEERRNVVYNNGYSIVIIS